MMTDEERYDMYEKTAPGYLRHDIEEYLKYKDDKNCHFLDCLLDEIYGSINSALWNGEISEEQANYLRDKYFYGFDWENGERSGYGTNRSKN